jgi:hypothetical protein
MAFVLASCLLLLLFFPAIDPSFGLWIPEEPEITQHPETNISLESEESTEPEEESRDGKIAFD